MITSKQCLAKFGDPRLEKFTRVYYFDYKLLADIPALPARIYCHELLIKPLETALTSVVRAGLEDEIKTWDGCFNIRRKRGAPSISLHSWGLAIDINAAWNPFGKPPTMSKELVRCFENAGFDWGGHWDKPDGMHFQLRSI